MNFEIPDVETHICVFVPFAETRLMLNTLNLVLQNSKLVLESLTFNLVLTEIILKLMAMGAGGEVDSEIWHLKS